MRYFAEFTISSDFELETDTGELIVNNPESGSSLTLLNDQSEGKICQGRLLARLIFNCEFEIRHARGAAFEELQRYMNTLTFSTSSMFIIERIVRLVEWDVGQKKRLMIAFSEMLRNSRPVSVLEAPMDETAERLIALQTGEQMQRCLRWYRLAIAAESEEDRFMYMWLALEIAASMEKTAEKVPSACPRCNAALYCEACGSHPTHRKFPAELIKSAMWGANINGFSDQIEKMLFKLRNALMHGRSLTKTAEEGPLTLTQAIDCVYYAAHSTIMRICFERNPKPPNPIVIGTVESISRTTISGGAHIEFDSRGESPSVSEIPVFDFKVLVQRESPQGRDDASEGG